MDGKEAFTYVLLPVILSGCCDSCENAVVWQNQTLLVGLTN